MTANAEIAELGLAGMALAIGRGDLSSREATAACLALMKTRGAALDCIAGIDTDAALAQADAADGALRGGRRCGPLHGVPLAHKDMFFRAGRLTEGGSRLFAGYRPTVTASALARLDDAGALDVARLKMSELAIGPMGHNPITGTPCNPWNRAHLAGGTSSGPAAAVAAGIVPAALASDTGGSTRLPAAFCGIVGLKPGYGRISRFGLLPVSSTLDHVGILARSVADAALLLSIVAGADAKDPTTSRRPPPRGTIAPGERLTGVRIGVPRRAFFDGIEGAAAAAAEVALGVFRDLGASLVEIDIPRAELGNPLASLIIMVEAAAAHRQAMAERPDDFAPETLARLRTGTLYAATDYRLALLARAELLRAIGEAAFTQADLLVTPTTGMAAPRIDGADLPAGTGFADLVGPIGRSLRLFNVTGLPAIALPAGLSPKGLPLSVQLVGRPYGETTILRAGAAFEAAVGGFPMPPCPPGGGEEGA